MNVIRDDTWTRKGCSLLWCPSALAQFAQPCEVVSMRSFFRLSSAWPEDLPSNKGAALVVAGLEGCLDLLSPEEVSTWIQQDLKPRIFRFQDEYQGDASLTFWLPAGRKRIRPDLATEEYRWSVRSGEDLPIGKMLWAGAEKDAIRIVDGPIGKDPEGDAWVGLYHPRIS